MRNLFTQNTNPSIALVASNFTPDMLRRAQESGAISCWAVSAIRNRDRVLPGFAEKKCLSFRRKKWNDRTGRDLLVTALGREHGFIMSARSNEIDETIFAVMVVARGEKGGVFGELVVADYT
jgi:hypothetical protein